jgi:PAS domain S-box-containing protein
MAEKPRRAPDTSRVLVVAEHLDRRIRHALSSLKPVLMTSGAQALKELGPESDWGVVFVSPALPDMTGEDFIRLARGRVDTVFILLHASETASRLNALLAAMPDPVFTLDLEGRCTSFYWGRAARFGIRPENLVGRTLREVFDPPLADSMLELLTQVYRTRQRQTREYAIGVGRWTLQFEITLTPILGAHQAVQSVAGIAHDVTQQRMMERQLQHTGRMELASRLATAFAHDFNNILSSILLKTDMALSMSPLADELRVELDSIRMESLLGAQLTRRLLGLVRRQPWNPTILDLDETIEGMLPMIRHLLSENIELRHRRTPNLWSVKADPAHIEQIIFNLALNARDAMPRGGRVTIETGNLVLDDRFAQNTLKRPGGDYVVLFVCDSGLGMGKEVRKHLFEPFYTTKEHGRGTGLGLACILDLTQQHDGGIVVHSQPGQGTRVELYFPRTFCKVDSSPVVS